MSCYLIRQRLPRGSGDGTFAKLLVQVQPPGVALPRNVYAAAKAPMGLIYTSKTYL
jgi:hypothetical protein